ncbi:hypothetical protein BGZ76_007433 [Entomortierella beljakovae]|nr:hypothetical protein BGZ76_007433 [Entomortierella beljakovae]
MDSQEKLEAMFCPRLDSALVASIYNEYQDFKQSVAILSALAASTPNDLGISSSSTDQMSNNDNNNNSNGINSISNQNTTSPPTKTKNKMVSDSNNKNILIWSEQVANSNTSSSSTPKTNVSTTRTNGLYKQGQVTNASSFQQPTSIIETRENAVKPAGSGSTSSSQKQAFRAVRNPNYLKKHGIVVEPEELEPEHQLDELISPDDQDEIEDDNQSAEEFPVMQTSQKQKAQKAAKKPNKNRKQKRGPKTLDTEVSVQLSDLQITGLSTDQEIGIPANEYDTGFNEFGEEGTDTDSQDTSSNREYINSEELQFLKSCFPDQDHSDEYLIEILKDSKRDLEIAIELILSQMFLDNEQVETSSTGSGSHYSSGSLLTSSSSATTSSLDDTFFQGVSKSKKKSKSGPRGGSNSAWGAKRHTVWDDQSDALTKTIEHQDEFLIPESNDWATFEHQISILMNIFHTVPRATIVSEYHSNGAHLFKTVESLETRFKQESQYEQGRQNEFDANLAQLVEMFPGHSTIGLKKLLVYNGGDFQDTMNAVLAADIVLGDAPKNQGLSFAQSVKRGTAIPFQANITFSDKNNVPNPTSSGNRLKSLPSSSNPFPGGARPFPNTVLDNSNSELYNDEDDPIACRHRAHEILEQRNELFRKAAQAYKATKGKGAGMGGIAAYYADEGKKLDSQGKQWHMRAARAVVQYHRHENNDPNLVDLHGLTVSEAQTVVREAVTQWFSRSTMQASRITAKPLKIVCGVGSHSKDRVARLYPSILSLLTRDGWRCEAGNGVILVKGVAKHSLSVTKKR